MRQLTLTNVQFDVLHDIVKDAIDELKCDLDEQTLYTTETYKIYAQLNNLQSPKVTNSDKVYPEVDNIPDNIKKDWLYNKVIQKVSDSEKYDPYGIDDYSVYNKELTHDSEGC